MQKRNNYYKKALILGMIVATLTLGEVALARAFDQNNSRHLNRGNSANNPASQDKEKNRGFCERIERWIEREGNRINEDSESIKSRVRNRVREFQERREQKLKNLEVLQSQSDKWRKSSYEELRAQAVTEEQKEAVENFIAAMEAAIQKRREAIRKALEEFHAGVRALHDSRKSKVESLLDSFRLSLQEAYSQAKKKCDEGVSEKTIRVELKNQIQAARGQLQKERKEQARTSEEMKKLVAAKQEAFKQALSVFKTESRQALEELRKVFPEAVEDEQPDQQ